MTSWVFLAERFQDKTVRKSQRFHELEYSKLQARPTPCGRIPLCMHPWPMHSNALRLSKLQSLTIDHVQNFSAGIGIVYFKCSNLTSLICNDFLYHRHYTKLLKSNLQSYHRHFHLSGVLKYFILFEYEQIVPFMGRPDSCRASAELISI